MRYLYIFLSVIIFSCGGSDEEYVANWKSIEKDLQTKFITVKDSSSISLPEGNFMFTRSLLLDGKKDITIQGAGIDKTILSFADQEEGAEGIKVSNCQNIKFLDMTIEDAPGDNIKVTDTYRITFANVRSRWRGEPDEKNGAYGFYPVLCQHVVIENCIASGASDAGIYVGQSDSVIIRNNVVFENVAGIESENSKWVEIYGNEAYENTGGILIFDLPGLTQSGHTTRVYKNRVYSNNFRNFAPEGNIVATVPPGTGIMLLATRNIEIFNNDIENNRTMGIGVASYDLVEALKVEEGTQLEENVMIAQEDADYDPYPNNIYIRNNVFRNKHWFPTTRNDFGLLFLTKFPFSTPDVVIDGIFPPGVPFQLCLSENDGMDFANLDAGNDFNALTTEFTKFDCQQTSIKPIFNEGP